jgi:hypothetical protein
MTEHRANEGTRIGDSHGAFCSPAWRINNIVRHGALWIEITSDLMACTAGLAPSTAVILLCASLLNKQTLLYVSIEV